MSEAHHHLPPLVKRGYGATVELHRHFLPKEKQGVNPLGPLFDTAHTRECCGAVYLVPSIEYQIIQLILGKFVHDGHLARRSFPLREALDFVCLMESSEKTLNLELLLRHCGHSFTTLSALVPQLMAYTPKVPFAEKNDVSKRIKLMQQRYNSPALAKLLDAHARVLYLANSLAYSPGKLSAYLRRQVSSN